MRLLQETEQPVDVRFRVQQWHKEIEAKRMTLTYYNVPRFYTAKRVDDAEMLTFLSYDGSITRTILESFRDRVKGGWDENVAAAMLRQNESLYRNGRQVMQMTLMGDIK